LWWFKVASQRRVDVANNNLLSALINVFVMAVAELMVNYFLL
jgi:hypothetical protein